MTNKTIPTRVDPKFKQALEEIKLERIKEGRDKKFKSDGRITLAIIRHENWQEIKEDIINSKLK